MKFAIALLGLLLSVPAWAQSSPGWQSRTNNSACAGAAAISNPACQPILAPQFNAAFAAKADLVGTATGSTFARDARDRYADVINVKDYGAVGNGTTIDTQGVTLAYQRANALMAAGTNVEILFPFGHYVVGAVPPLLVPDGVALGVSGARGGTQISATTATSPVSIHEVAVPGASNLQPVVSGLTVNEAVNGVGGNAVEIVAVPRTSGGAGMAPDLDHITCTNSASGNFTNCLYLADVSNAAIQRLRNIGLPSGTGLPTQGVGIELFTTPNGTANSNYSVDDHIDDFEQVGGFAAIRADNHVEGVQLENATLAAMAYGLYSPAWPGGTSGLLWLSIAHSHIDAAFAGVYCEICTSVKVNGNLLYSLGSVTPTAGALLPVNWATFAGNNTAWIGVWCPDCKGVNVSGNEYYGFLRSGQKTAAISLFGYDFGAGVPATLWGNSINGNVIAAMTAGSILIDASYGKTTVDDNALNTTTLPLSQTISPAAGVSMTGNLQDGSPADAGLFQGYYRITSAPLVVSQTLQVNGIGSCSPAGAQGAAFCWNLAGSGETDIVNTRGNGPGGFIWLNANPDTTLATPASAPLAHLAPDGTFTTKGPIVSGSYVSASGPMHLYNTTVSALPAACTPGDEEYVTDGRKSGEAAGAGSGVPVICTYTQQSGGSLEWYSLWSGAQVTN